MPQFDVFRNSTSRSSDNIPYLVDVQADVLATLNSRVVIPLYRAAAIPRPISTLQPTFTVEGESVVMSTRELAGVPMHALGGRVGTLAADRASIIAALDLLFTGV